MPFSNVAIGLIFLCAVGCVKVPPPEVLPEYAVFCVLSPEDSLLTVTLSRVVPVGERFRLDSTVVVPASAVMLTEGLNTVRLAFNPRTRRYEAPNNRFVRPDAIYSLTVQLPDHPPLLARCTVPSVCPEFSTSGQLAGDDYVFTVDWPDIAGQENQYYLTGTVEGGFPTKPGQVTVGMTGISWGNGFNPRFFSTDKDRDGQRQYAPEGTIRKAATATEPMVMELVLQNMDKTYFDYGQKGFGRIANDNGLFSRFREPILVSSNVENGLGIFGAFTQSKARFRVN